MTRGLVWLQFRRFPFYAFIDQVSGTGFVLTQHWTRKRFNWVCSRAGTQDYQLSWSTEHSCNEKTNGTDLNAQRALVRHDFPHVEDSSLIFLETAFRFRGRWTIIFCFNTASCDIVVPVLVYRWNTHIPPSELCVQPRRQSMNSKLHLEMNVYIHYNLQLIRQARHSYVTHLLQACHSKQGNPGRLQSILQIKHAQNIDKCYLKV